MVTKDRQNSPNYILRLTKLANGSRNEGYTGSSEDDVDGSSDDDPDVTFGYHTNDQLPRLDAGLVDLAVALQDFSCKQQPVITTKTCAAKEVLWYYVC